MLMPNFSILSLAPIGAGFAIVALGAVYYFLNQEMSRRRLAEVVLRQQTERERLINQIAHHIRKSLNLEEVLATTVAEVQKFLQADRVLIYRIWEDGTGSAITETVLSGYTKILGETFSEEVFPKESHLAYLLGKTCTITNVEQADVEPCLINFLKQFGVKAKLVVPILQENREADQQRDSSKPPSRPHLWGLLIAHQCDRPRIWKPWEVQLMKQLATQVAIAIQQSELYKQLQKLNQELELRVQQRTEELATANTFLRAEVTERKQAEQALRQSEERFRSLIENALDIVKILDMDGSIRYESPSVEKILGYPATELIGKNLLDYIHPDDFINTYYSFTHAIQSREVSAPIEFRYRHKDGSWRTLEAISQKFLDNTAETRIMVNCRDITERKRLDEIRLALERERELSVLKTRFFSMASHEFRTPLSTVLAAAQLLENCQDEWDNSSKRLRNLQRIQISVKYLVQMLDDILTINRAETGKLEFNPKPLNLETFCSSFVEEMRLSAGERHTLKFVCQGKPVSTYVDERLLRSILSNLLLNAIKYSPHGGDIHFTLEFKADTVILQFQDWGIGIPVAEQKQLFEPFHRGSNVRSIPGTGLGLVVVKKCVDLHQGIISITSAVGSGTTCKVTLPLLRKSDPQ